MSRPAGSAPFDPASLLLSGDRLAHLVRVLPEGVYLAGARGGFLDGNRGMLDLLAAGSVEELRAHSLEETFVDPQEWTGFVEALVGSGGVWELERAVRRLNGDTVYALDLGCVVTVGTGGEQLLCGILVDVQRYKEVEQDLRALLVRDPLTGCFNRRFLEQFAGSADDVGGRWGAIVIDIDGFKCYNDEHGHQAGDYVLIQLTGFLQRSVRAEDAVVRLGGDEFLVLLSGANARHTSRVAARLQQTAAAMAPVPFSLGRAVRQRRESLEDTIARADAKMRHVKVRGRRPRRRRGETR